MADDDQVRWAEMRVDEDLRTWSADLGKEPADLSDEEFAQWVAAIQAAQAEVQHVIGLRQAARADRLDAREED